MNSCSYLDFGAKFSLRFQSSFKLVVSNWFIGPAPSAFLGFLHYSASAAFSRALALWQISPSKGSNDSTRVVGLYLLLLSVPVGFRIP